MVGAAAGTTTSFPRLPPPQKLSTHYSPEDGFDAELAPRRGLAEDQWE